MVHVKANSPNGVKVVPLWSLTLIIAQLNAFSEHLKADVMMETQYTTWSYCTICNFPFAYYAMTHVPNAVPHDTD